MLSFAGDGGRRLGGYCVGLLAARYESGEDAMGGGVSEVPSAWKKTLCGRLLLLTAERGGDGAGGRSSGVI